jgi:hypothetical protein
MDTNIEKTKIQLISHCSKNTEVRKVLQKTYSQTILDTGKGLAGKVWELEQSCIG